MSNTSPKRYSPLWVTIHWLVALLIFATFYFGISTEEASAATKVSLLKWHMPLGISVILLMLVRLYLRWRAPRPADATAGNAFFDFIGKWTHYLLYALALLVPLTGLVLSASNNLMPIVFGGGEFPADLEAGLHGLLDPLLALLILLHIGAALYHQFILRDNLLARMWYGK
ncbi:MAG: cytochrome b [Anaerolineae bacterium]